MSFLSDNIVYRNLLKRMKASFLKSMLIEIFPILFMKCKLLEHYYFFIIFFLSNDIDKKTLDHLISLRNYKTKL